MTKINRYRYLGRNGILTTSILLQDTTPILMYRLIADEGKALTNGEKYVRAVEIFVEDLDQWTEVDIPSPQGQ